MEWQPIEKEKKLKAGFKRIYTFKHVDNERRPYAPLNRTYHFDKAYGFRECDYYIDIPLPESALNQ